MAWRSHLGVSDDKPGTSEVLRYTFRLRPAHPGPAERAAMGCGPDRFRRCAMADAEYRTGPVTERCDQGDRPAHEPARVAADLVRGRRGRGVDSAGHDVR